MGKLRIGRFWSTVLTLVAIYALIKWGTPWVSREVTNLPFRCRCRAR